MAWSQTVPNLVIFHDRVPKKTQAQQYTHHLHIYCSEAKLVEALESQGRVRG